MLWVGMEAPGTRVVVWMGHLGGICALFAKIRDASASML